MHPNNGVEHPLDVEEVRDRIRKMTDEQLLRCGVVAKYMCSPDAHLGKASRAEFVLQLREARKEWKRRKRGTVIEHSF